MSTQSVTLYQPIVEVAEVAEFWVPESHLARLVVGAKVRVRLGECPLVGRWREMSARDHDVCHQPEANGAIGVILNTDWSHISEKSNAPGHTYEVRCEHFDGHYAAAELEPVEEMP